MRLIIVGVLVALGVMHGVATAQERPNSTTTAATYACQTEPGGQLCTQWMLYCAIDDRDAICAPLGFHQNPTLSATLRWIDALPYGDARALASDCNVGPLDTPSLTAEAIAACKAIAPYCAVSYHPFRNFGEICPSVNLAIARNARPDATPPTATVLSVGEWCGRLSVAEITSRYLDKCSPYLPEVQAREDRNRREQEERVAAKADAARWRAVDRRRRVLRLWAGPGISHVAGQSFRNAFELDLQLLPLDFGKTRGLEAAIKVGTVGGEPAPPGVDPRDLPRRNRMELSAGLVAIKSGRVRAVAALGAGFDSLVDRDPVGFLYGKLSAGRWLNTWVRVDGLATYFVRGGPDELRLGLWATVSRFALGVEHTRVFGDLDVTTVGLGLDLLANHH